MECKQIGTLTGGVWDKMHEQSRRVYDKSGLSPALNTCGGGGHDIKIAEPKERFFKQALETARNNKCEIGDTINAYNESIDKSGVSPTVTTRPEGFKTAILPIDQTYRIRKLTPLECLRLMGFDDEDYEKVQAIGMSDSQIYKQAGNSIVVNVLEKIFEKII